MKNGNTWTQRGEYQTLGSIGGKRGGPVGGGGGEGLPGEKCQIWVKGRKQTKHTAMCVPMQLYCMLCSCTPKPKIQKKIKKKNSKVKAIKFFNTLKKKKEKKKAIT